MKAPRRHLLAPLLVLPALALPLLAVPATAQAQPAFSKIVSPDTIGPGSAATLVYTIQGDGVSPAGALAFSETLPAGVAVATPSGASTDCSFGEVSAPAGGGTIAFSGGRLGAGERCEIRVLVTSSTPGTHTSVSGDLTSTAGNSGPASADLTVATDRPGFTKQLAPGTVWMGEVSTLTYTLDNTLNPAQALNATFTDTLPAGLVVAEPAGAQTTCTGGLVDAVSGGASIALSNGLVDAGASCTVSVDVEARAGGTLESVTGPLTVLSGWTQVTSGLAAAALQSEVAPLHLQATVLGDPETAGSRVTLRFTVRSFDRQSGAQDLAFTADLGAALPGLEATGLPATDPCGAGSSLSGASTLILAGGSLPAGGVCTFDVTVQLPASASAGAYGVTTGQLTGDVAGTVVTGNPATARLYVAPIPRLTQTILTRPAVAGGTLSVEFTLANGSPSSSATGIAFTDALTDFLPGIGGADVVLPPAGSCGAGSTFSFVQLATDVFGLVFQNGSLAPGAGCTFQVELTVPPGTPNGVYANVTSPVTATVDGAPVTGPAAADSVQILAPPSLQLSVDGPATGGTVDLRFTLTLGENAPTDATDVAFTVDLAAALPGLAATGLPAAGVCGAGSQLSGTTVLSLTGGTLAPRASCTFTVSLLLPAGAGGVYTLSTSEITATLQGTATTGAPATAELGIPRLVFTKSFVDDPALPGATVTARYTLQNVSGEVVTGLFFTDDLRSAVPGTTTTGLPQSDPCGAGSSLQDVGAVLFQGGSLSPGESCSFSVTVQLPAGAAEGTYHSATSSLQASVGGTPVLEPPASDTLVVGAPLVLSKAFVDAPVAPGDPVTLAYTLANAHGTGTVTDIAFTDDLAAVLPGLLATGLPPSDPCGAGSVLTGTDLLTFAGGTLAPGAECSFEVLLQTPTGVPLGVPVTSVSSPVAGVLDGVAFENDPAVATLELRPLSVGIAFAPAVAGETTTLTVTLENLGTLDAAEDLSLVHDLGAALPGLSALGLPADDVCGAGSRLSGTSVLTLRGGRLGPGEACAFDVTLDVPAVTGTFESATGPLHLFGEPVAPGGVATLEVSAVPPTLALSLDPQSVLVGEASRMALSIDNGGSAVAATSLGVTVDLPVGLSVADPPAASTTCQGGTLTAQAGDAAASYLNGTVAAGAACEVSVDVVADGPGSYLVQSGELTSSSGRSGTAEATLEVSVVPPGLSMDFDPGTVEEGGTSRLALDIDNSASRVPTTELSLTVDLPAGLAVADPSAASTTCEGGTLQADAGGAAASYVGGTVGAGETCAVALDVAAGEAGTFLVESGEVTSSMGSSGTASATLAVEPAPVPDGGSPDGGEVDGGSADGGVVDAGSPDGGAVDGGAPDGADGGGCGCSASGGRGGTRMCFVGLFAVALLGRRRRG